MEHYLLVDDDERLRPRLATALRERGAEVTEARGPTEALALVRGGLVPTRAVLDLRMPDGDGLTLLESLVAVVPGLRAVMLTGYGSIATTVDAMRLGAVNYLTKPADADQILAAFSAAEAPPLAVSSDYEPASLDQVEWEHIQRVLDDCGGNITHAAKKLGVHRRTLQRKLATYRPLR